MGPKLLDINGAFMDVCPVVAAMVKFRIFGATSPPPSPPQERQLHATCQHVLWVMYLDMVKILTRFIIAERTGLWECHLSSAREMLPYLVAAGHFKYVSCLPHYLEAMEQLPQQVKTAFEDGKFTVHRKKGKFNGVWPDMALEQSYNKDAKTNLFHGISNKSSTMSKYVYALPSLTAISEQILDMVSMNDNAGSSAVTSNAKVDMEIHRKVYGIIKEKMIDPFQYQEGDLINISNRDVA